MRNYRFVLDKSTVTNVLSCDDVIVNAIFQGHSNDIISFDFKSVFDKVSHRVVIKALAAKGVHGIALS